MTRQPFTSVGDFTHRGLAYAHKRYTRRFMPVTAPVLYAGYPSNMDWRLFDHVLPKSFRPPEIDDVPDYEQKLIDGLRRVVRPGARVVVVGGGTGTTAVVAADLAGPSGAVICYEAASEQMPVLRETFRRNGVAVDLRYGAVGAAIAVYGERGHEAPVVPAADLPECDVLEMDCEGAECVILDGMAIRPAAVVVETHGVYGAPTAAVARRLEALGYEIDDLGIAEPRVASLCREWDINVLLGLRASTAGAAPYHA